MNQAGGVNPLFSYARLFGQCSRRCGGSFSWSSRPGSTARPCRRCSLIGPCCGSTMIKVAFSSRQAAVAALSGLVALTAVGCGSGGSSSASGSGQLSVLMADAPPNLGGNVTAVNVTVTKVEVHPGTDSSSQDTPWKTVFQGAKSFNLLDLANKVDL